MYALVYRIPKCKRGNSILLKFAQEKQEANKKII